MRARLLAAAAVALGLSATALWASGCGAGPGGIGGRECTVVGCDDGVTFDLGGIDGFGTEDLTVETCIGRACRAQAFPASGGGRPAWAPMLARTSPAGTLAPGQRLPVSVRVETAHGRVLIDHAETVTLQAHHPNGPDCPPTCAQATVRPAAR